MARLKGKWIDEIHDPLESGGYGVYEDADGDVWLEHCEPPDDEAIARAGFSRGRSFTGTEEPDAEDFKGGASPLTWTVHREEIERFVWVQDPDDAGRRHLLTTSQARYASQHSDHANRVEWWVKRLGEVADTCGFTLDHLHSRLCSGSVLDRAEVYICAIGHFGWHEFDQYPVELDEAEVRERYGLEDIEELEALRDGKKFVAAFSYELPYQGMRPRGTVTPGALIQVDQREYGWNLGRVLDRPLYDGCNERLKGRWVRVVAMCDDGSYGYTRYVQVDNILSARSGPFHFARWFFSEELPKPEDIERANRYGSLSDSYINGEAAQRMFKGLPPRKEDNE